MSITVYNLSPTPVCHLQGVFAATDEELNFISSLEEIASGNVQMNSQIYGGNFITKTTTILDYPEMKRIRDFLQENLDAYVKNILQIDNKFRFTDTWSTRNPQGSFHSAHSHPNSIFSGVLYLKANSGDFVVGLDPKYSENFKFHYNIAEYNLTNSLSWKFPVRTGDLLIFPSHLDHKVTVNEHPEDRRIIAFNSFVTGYMGNPINVTQLTL